MLVEQVHEFVVVHFVEKRLQIDVHHILFALLDELLRRGFGGIDGLQIKRRKGKFGPEASGLEGEARLGGFRFAAGSEDPLDATAPGFDFPGAEKDMRDGELVSVLNAPNPILTNKSSWGDGFLRLPWMERAWGENFIAEWVAGFLARNKTPPASQIGSGKSAAGGDGAAPNG
jgi:hypothetical protein